MERSRHREHPLGWPYRVEHLSENDLRVFRAQNLSDTPLDARIHCYEASKR
jgi:hypothetical protein